MIKPTEKQIEAGQAVASEMIDAQVRHCCDGLGGCKEFDINDFKYREIVWAYVHNEIDSVTGIWIAMQEAAEENNE